MAGKEKPKAPGRATATPEKTTEGERIAKVLSRAGVASRREAERLIELGEVSVNGKVITSPALNVTAADKITVRGEPVGAPEPARLWLYYKPEGLVTSASDEKGRDTVFDHLPEDMPRVMSVGRLDLNSEGLLLLTNDGALKRRLELPSTGWLRKYRVRVKGNPTEPEIEPLRKGIVIDGERFQPMEVKIDRHQGANAWLTVGLREGKNREIRRAMDHIGVTVNRLIRVSYGPFRLNELEPGEVEEVRPKVLREQLGMAQEPETTTLRRADRRPAGADARPAGRGKEAGVARAGKTDATRAETGKTGAGTAGTGRAGTGNAGTGKAGTGKAGMGKAPSGKPAAKPRPMRPGEGLKTLSETWQKATARPRRDSAEPTRPDGGARPGARKPRPPAPRKG